MILHYLLKRNASEIFCEESRIILSLGEGVASRVGERNSLWVDEICWGGRDAIACIFPQGREAGGDLSQTKERSIRCTSQKVVRENEVVCMTNGSRETEYVAIKKRDVRRKRK